MRHQGQAIWLAISLLIFLSGILYWRQTGNLAGIIFFVLIVACRFFGVKYLRLKKELATARSVKEQLESLFANPETLVWSFDPVTEKIKLSGGLKNLFGLTAGEISIEAVKDFFPDGKKINTFFKVIKEGHAETLVLKVRDKKGKISWLEVSAVPVLNEQGKVLKFIGTAQDLSRQKATERKLKRVINFDTLTGLPNRDLFLRLAERAIDRSRSNKEMLALILIDLDRFRLINNVLGYEVGEEILRQIAKRFMKLIKKGDIAARHNSDEFLLFLQVKDKEEAEAAVRRLRDSITAPFIAQGREIFVSCSIGVSLYPENGDNIKELFRKADKAMNQVKLKEKNNYQFYLPGSKDTVRRKIELEQAIKSAYENRQFKIVYQPKVCLQTGKIFAVEALLRWIHPSLGNIPPKEFISVAEEIGMILPLGKWVLEEACKQNRKWQERGIYVNMDVNVSALQFEHYRFIQLIEEVLEKTKIDPAYLGLEITESLMQNFEKSAEIIWQLKKIGVKVSIDDFGIGYSSLNKLSKLPIDVIKIDKCFIQEIFQDDKTAALVKTFIEIGKKFKIQVLAEGIESEETVQFLLEHGCYFGQGYYYSPPREAAKIEKILQQNRPASRSNYYLDSRQ